MRLHDRGIKMDQFMKRAVELSIQNVREGGEPFGAVLVKDGQIVSEGTNELHKKYDVSGHAEMIAIRKAQSALQTHDLSGYTMYASGEPCPMCLTMMYMSGIENGYYCTSIEETAAVRSEEHTSELQSRGHLVCRLLLEKKKQQL